MRNRPLQKLGFISAGKRRRSPEYPCVSRFRQRRLISFLWHQNLYDATDALVGRTDAYMSLKLMVELVEAGLWDEAIQYLSRFLPSDRRLGVHGRSLFHFLRLHKAIAEIVAGANVGNPVAAALRQCIVRHGTKSRALNKLRGIFSTLLHCMGFRDSLDWGRVRTEASLTVMELVSEAPELKDHRALAGGSMKPQNVLPMGFGYASFRPRRHVKKRGRIPPSVVAGLYLQKKKMLPSSTSSHCQGLSRESLIKAKEWLVDRVGTNLRAAKIRQGDPLQSACARVTRVSPTILATFRRRFCDLSELELMYKAREWVLYLTEECLEAWPDLSHEYQRQFLTFCKEDGDPIARVSQTMPDTFTSHPENFAISSVTRAGAPFSQTMFGTLTNPDKNFGISSVTNTDLADCVISSVTNSGKCKHLSQEDCYGSASQNFGSRKNPRMELMTVGEGSDPKRQRTSPASLIGTEAENHLAACLLAPN